MYTHAHICVGVSHAAAGIPPYLFDMHVTKFWCVVSAGALLLAAEAPQVVGVDPQDAFRLVGRGAAAGTSVSFDSPGAWIEAQWRSSAPLSGSFSKIGSVDDYFVVLCDGKRDAANFSFSTVGWKASEPRIVALCSTPAQADEVHTVRIFKATEAMWNSLQPQPNYVSFHGFEAPAITKATPAAAKRIEFLGDSITAGFCNLCPAADGHNGPDRENYFLSWANLVCAHFGADCHTSAWSGYGIVENCCGGSTLMPDIWERTLATIPSQNTSDPHGTVKSNHWNFTRWAPDAVVINLGTNDELQSRPANVEAFRTHYLALVNRARAAYGRGTHFFLACGPMSKAYCSSVDWVIAATGDVDRVHFLDHRGFLNGTFGKSCCGHPSARVDAAMADATISRLASVLGWS